MAATKTTVATHPFVVQVLNDKGRWVRFDDRDSFSYGHAAMRRDRFAAKNKGQKFRVYDRASKTAWALAA